MLIIMCTCGNRLRWLSNVGLVLLVFCFYNAIVEANYTDPQGMTPVLACPPYESYSEPNKSNPDVPYCNFFGCPQDVVVITDYFPNSCINDTSLLVYGPDGKNVTQQEDAGINVGKCNYLNLTLTSSSCGTYTIYEGCKTDTYCGATVYVYGATNYPTSQPTSQPTSLPTVTFRPTSQPSSQPSALPTSCPSTSPSGQPSSCPSGTPSSCPSGTPSSLPTGQPSSQPTTVPSSTPKAQTKNNTAAIAASVVVGTLIIAVAVRSLFLFQIFITGQFVVF
jgi:hypothetical protein